MTQPYREQIFMRFHSSLIRRGALALTILLFCQVAAARGSFNWSPFYPVGEAFPEATLTNQDGESVTLSEASGSKGYLVVLNRSVDW
jgi:cytochrome oxidase Cu insertion factor (SCO1/SenC/PrrC family)